MIVKKLTFTKSKPQNSGVLLTLFSTKLQGFQSRHYPSPLPPVAPITPPGQQEVMS
jgi:hypothetical protein